MMATVFTKIIQGIIPCYKVAEDSNFLAFLDISPLQKGHVLIVPKVEVDYVFDLDDEILSKWLLFAKPIAAAMKKAFPCNRVSIHVIGLEVPHAHMHLLPINRPEDVLFSNPKLKFTPEEYKEIAEKIAVNM